MRRLAGLALVGMLLGGQPLAVAAAVEGDLAPAAVLALAEEDNSRIVVVDPDGRARVLTEGAYDVAPVAAPDGARVAFIRLPDPDQAEGELAVVDLHSARVDRTGITVDRTVPLLWADDATLLSTTPAGIVRIRPAARFVEFVPGTAAGQVALDVTGSRVLASRGVVAEDRHFVELIELRDTGPPTVLWSSQPEGRATIATAAYGPAGGVSFVSTISSSGFGTVQYVHFLDPQGNAAQEEDIYGGDSEVNLHSGPFWQPDGRAVLLGGAGSQRFPGQENPPAALLVEGPGAEHDRTVTTREQPQVLQALGWRPDGSALVAVTDAPDADAALLVLSPDGEVLREVSLPGDFTAAVNPSRFGTPNADLLPPIRRSGGTTRTATAAAVSQHTFPAGMSGDGPLADEVVIARADVYADALAGAPLARHRAAPLLLTGSDGLDSATAAEIERLGATRAILLGGESAIGPQVVAELQERGLQVRRIAGRDRFATAAVIAEELPAGARVILVEGAHADPGRGWPDALSAAPLAAALTLPLLLTTSGQLPEATAAALRERAPDIVMVVGGPAAVSETVAEAAANAARGTHERIAGSTRVGTSVAVADAMIALGAGSAASLWLATATNWPDALAAGPAVVADHGVLLLTPAQAQDSELPAFLQRTQSRTVRLVGGPGVIGGQALHHVLLAAALGGPQAQPIDVS